MVDFGKVMTAMVSPFKADLSLDYAKAEELAKYLASHGSDALVVHGTDGLDEITVSGLTKICELKNGGIDTYSITPEDLGLARAGQGGLRRREAVGHAGHSGGEDPGRDPPRHAGPPCAGCAVAPASRRAATQGRPTDRPPWPRRRRVPRSPPPPGTRNREPGTRNLDARGCRGAETPRRGWKAGAGCGMMGGERQAAGGEVR